MLQNEHGAVFVCCYLHTHIHCTCIYTCMYSSCCSSSSNSSASSSSSSRYRITGKWSVSHIHTNTHASTYARAHRQVLLSRALPISINHMPDTHTYIHILTYIHIHTYIHTSTHNQTTSNKIKTFIHIATMKFPLQLLTNYLLYRNQILLSIAYIITMTHTLTP